MFPLTISGGPLIALHAFVSIVLPFLYTWHGHFRKLVQFRARGDPGGWDHTKESK